MFPGVTSRSGDATASVHSPPSRKLRRVRSNPQISANPLPLAPSSGRGHPQGVISLGADWMNDHADVALPWALECAMTLIPSLRHSRPKRADDVLLALTFRVFESRDNAEA